MIAATRASKTDADSPGHARNAGVQTEPDFLDFTYFSFVIDMTSQVSDLQITSPESAAARSCTASSPSPSTPPSSP
jgi:uncharacterized membrane protein